MKQLTKALLLAAALLGAGSAAVAQEKDPDLEYATELLKSGEKAPGIELGDINGHSFNLSSIKNKYIVLVFWASWCPDCRAEVPLLKEMYKRADLSKVEFVSVSYDRDIEKWKAYVKENELPGIQLFDPSGKKGSAVGASFKVKWIPSLYLIDPDGKIVFGTVVAEKIDSFIKNL